MMIGYRCSGPVTEYQGDDASDYVSVPSTHLVWVISFVVDDLPALCESDTSQMQLQIQFFSDHHS